jgi:hypothetical protein
MLLPESTEEADVWPFRAVVVSNVMGVTRLKISEARFSREFEEIERFWVLISNISRFLFVTPASMEIKMHIMLTNVSPNGKATQTNLPAPILFDF